MSEHEVAIPEHERRAMVAALAPHVPVGFDPAQIPALILALLSVMKNPEVQAFLAILWSLFKKAPTPPIPNPAPAPVPGPLP